MSLRSSINSQPKYGSTTTRSVMLSVIDSKLFEHRVTPTDTLPGLAIKYGITVEKLKRINKLWSNDSLRIKEKLYIPCSSSSDYENVADCLVSKEYFLSKSQKSQRSNELNKMRCDLTSSGELESNSTESPEKNDPTNDSYKSFTELLSRIDGQIKSHKDKLAPFLVLNNLPPVVYDSYQELQTHTSPTRTYNSLEQNA